MPNTKQIDPLDIMATRLEEANAHAYEQFARADESVLKSEQDETHHPSDQQNPSAVRERSHRRSALRGLMGLLLAACIFVAAFVSQSSYGNGAKLIVARWANASILQSAPHAQAMPRDVTPAASPISPELTEWRQTMARDLANLEQMIRSGAEVVEEIKTSQEQMVRNNAEVAEQLKAALTQMARDNAAVAEQLKARQEQLTVVMSSRAVGPARKASRMRKPMPILPSMQARAHSQAPVR